MSIDSFDQNAQDVGLSLDLIEEEIEAGLPLHADRLVEAYDCEEFYAGRNVAYIPRREGEDWRDYVRRPKRTSKLTRKVIRKLAEDLYSPGPNRLLENGTPEDAWLQDVYTKNHVNALMKAADRKATLHGACAIQCYGTGRPEKPVRLYLWAAHEFLVWTWPDDPCEVWAVCTIGKERKLEHGYVQERLKYDVYSRDEHRAYLTRWHQAPAANGPTYTANSYRYLFGVPATYQGDLSGEPAGSGVNPYGVLPFSFVHAEPPVSDFWEGGIGSMLVECNRECDRELSDLAQHARECMDPDRFTRGVSVTWRREKRAGQWQALIASKSAMDDGGVPPEAFLVQPELNVEKIWANITTYANSTLEELDVPLVAIRADASTDLSGIAIVAKHLPLLQRTKSRQPDFAIAEIELAGMVLTAAGNFYNQPRLTSAGLDARLALIWPEPRFPLPTPERDAGDKWELDEGVKSLVDVTAERYGITREQAQEHLERVAEDNEWLATVMPPPAVPPPPPQQPGALPAPVAEESDEPQQDEES